MGQARNRGTFEERKNKSISDATIRRNERIRIDAEIEAAMTPKQREERKKRRQKINTFISIAAGLSVL